MAKVRIEDKKGNLLFQGESDFIPNEGEYVWLDSSAANPDARKVSSRVIDVNHKTKKLDIVLLVE